MERAPQTLSDTGRRSTVRFPRALKSQVVDSGKNREKEYRVSIQLVILFLLCFMKSGLEQLFLLLHKEASD